MRPKRLAQFDPKYPKANVPFFGRRRKEFQTEILRYRFKNVHFD
jgi:hypothetical protein